MSDELTTDSPFKHLVTVVIENNQYSNKLYHFGYRDHECLAMEQAAIIAINGLRVRKRTGQIVFYPVHRVVEVRVDVDLQPEDFDTIVAQGHYIYEP